MRLAVYSDIHGNRLALDAVLAAIEQAAPDLVINLGDLFSGSLQPKATAERIRPLNHLVIKGNHERQLLAGPTSASDRLARSQLSHDDLNWIAALPERLEPAPGVVAVHGTPRSDLEYLTVTVDENGARPASDAEITERLGADAAASLVLCGHTHLATVRQLPGGPLVVNPGSVGTPAFAAAKPRPHYIETGSPQARYALLENQDGIWAATLHQVEYDWEAAARIAERNHRPEAAYSLRTGLAPRK